MGISLSYYSETQMRITATPPAGSPGYFSGFRAEVSVDDGAWGPVGPPQGWVYSTTQYSAQELFPVESGHVYRVRMTAYYGGKNWYNTSGVSGYVSTTPLAPLAPTVTVDGTTATITRTGALPYVVTGWRIERREAGGAWTSRQTLPASTASWDDTGLDRAKVYDYRLVALATWGATTRTSDPSSSVQVPADAPPLAPTDLAPTLAGAATDTVLTYQYNPVDLTPLSAHEYRHRADAGDPWTSTGKLAATEPGWTLTGGTYPAGTDMLWQVRAWGGHADPSPWSTTAVLALRAAPTATLTSPTGASWGSPTLTATWDYTSPTSSPQAQWRLVLSLDSEVVEELTGTGQAGAATMSTRLVDGQTYSLALDVADSDGLWSPVVAVAVPVSYDPPPTPTLAATWQPDDGLTMLEVTVPESGPGEVAVTSVTVERSWPGAAGWKVVGELVESGQVTDFVPPTRTVVTYRAVAEADTGAAASSAEIDVPTDTCWLFINHGPTFANIVRLRSNVTASRSHGRDKTLAWYDGRERPVETAGRARSGEYSVSASMWAPWASADNRGQSTWEELVAAADAAAPVCIRDGRGTRIFGSTSAVDESDLHEDVSRVSLTITPTGWDEP